MTEQGEKDTRKVESKQEDAGGKEQTAISDGNAAAPVAAGCDVSSKTAVADDKDQGKKNETGGEQQQPSGPVTAVAGVLPNPFSFLLFSWMTPVFVAGWRRPLRHSDLPLLPAPLRCAATSDKFNELWRARTGTSKSGASSFSASSASSSSPTSPKTRAVHRAAAEGKAGLPLAKTLLVLNRERAAGSLALQLLQAGLQFAGPLLLKRIVTFLQSPASGSPGSGRQKLPANGPASSSPVSLREAYVSAILMFVFPFVGAAAFVHSSRLAATTQVRVRAQLMGALYRKAAALSPRSRARADAEAGRVVNLMSTDVATIAQFAFPFANQLVSAPLFILVALILLYNQIRWATFIGFAVLALSSPLSTRFVKIISRRRREMLQHTDRRVRLTNQLLTGIRVLKLYGWEAAQEAAVLAARDAELGRLRAAIPARVGMQTLLFAAPVLAAVASFAAYGAASASRPGQFTPANVFAAIALFALMRLPLILLPFALVEASNALVSARRLSQFLLLEEREEGAVRDLAGAVGLRIREGNFYWPPEETAKEKRATSKKEEEEEKKKQKEDSKKKKRKDKKGEGKKEAEVEGADNGGGDAVVVELPPDDDGDDSALPTSSRAAGPADAASAVDAADVSTAEAATRSATASTRYGAAPLPGFVLPGSGGSEGEGDAESGPSSSAACYWLRDIDLDVGPGELVALVGRVGSGKSSVVSAALGNMGVASPGGGVNGAPPVVRRGGRVALVAQGAWIANASLKDNVLFGEEFDEEKWKRALDAACLGPDLETLPAGAATEIGEKGINLSGGQKQRVALARAAYADADLYLFDDPLSALDVHVGAAVFERLVLGLRRRGKAVLLATNQLQFLPFADKVCYLENGRIAAQGAPQDAALKECAGFQELLADYEATAKACGDSSSGSANGAGTAPSPAASASAAAAAPSSSSSALDASVVTRTRRERADALLPSATAGTMLPRSGSEGAASASASSASASAAAAAAAAAAAPPPQQPAPPSAASSSSSSSSRVIRRVPTFAIEQETRLEALHDAAGGARGLNRAGGVPPLESAFARESGPRPGERGDGDGDRDDDGEEEDNAAAENAEGASASPSSSSSSRRHSLSALPSPRRDNSLGAGFLDLVTGARTRRGASLEIGGGGSTLASRAASMRQNSQSLSQQLQGRRSSGSLPATPNTAAAAAASAAAAESVAKASKDAEDAAKNADAAAPDATKTGGTLVRAEDQEEGAVGSAVYSFYVARYGRAAFTALITLWVSEQAARVITNWWLSRWTGAEALAAAAAASPGAPAVDVRRTLRLGGYLGLSLAFVLFSCLRSATNLTSAARASKAVHAAALAALSRSPVSFFDQTPVGRSLNRFSRDVDDVDYLLPQSLNDAGNCVAQLASALVFIAIVQPFFLAGLAPILLFYYLLTKIYRASYVELQRNDAVSRSPVFAHFAESLNGVDTIRAFGRAGAFRLKFERLVDRNHAAFFSLRSADQWLSLRLELCGSGIVLLAAVLSIAARRRIPASLAALSLTEALDVTGFLKYLVMSAAMLEARMNAVERLRAYSLLPPEAARETVAEKKPASDWPTRGDLSFRDVWLRYRPGLEPALRGVSFSLEAGAKAGVVGRTGSGKSSLVVALFRLVEPCGGTITLDGVDLLSLGLDDVRGRVAAIPQDPVLFSASIRFNLDPYSRASDAEVWAALDVVQLRGLVAEDPLGLSARVAEDGGNWSVGQRQLLCVARALLRRPRVLVMDEATSSCDASADALIQAAVRSEFAQATVLTIAHRLATVLDSSRILVMEKGKLAEQGGVRELLEKEGGLFRALVEGSSSSSS